LKVLCSPTPPSCQLQKEEVWTQQPAPPQEEDQVERWLFVFVHWVQDKLEESDRPAPADETGLGYTKTCIACFLLL
jgi:hypothetical protein